MGTHVQPSFLGVVTHRGCKTFKFHGFGVQGYPELPKAKLNLHVTLKDSLYSKFLFYFSTCGNKYMVDNENSSGAKNLN